MGEREPPADGEGTSEGDSADREPTRESPPSEQQIDHGRRAVIGAAGMGALGLGGVAATEGTDFLDLFRSHYTEMSDAERERLVDRLETDLQAAYDDPAIDVSTARPMAETVFGLAIDVGACIGCRRCVYACAEENNLSREESSVPSSNQLHWIRVVGFDTGETDDGSGDEPDGNETGTESGGVSAGIDWHRSEHYYDPDSVPEEDSWYLPVQCQHCENPSCTTVCPVQATWKEEDGIVVVDYDRCIGCKYCVTNCPYDARRFNFSEPHLPADEVNPDMHYLGNRPRPGEVVEKCTFCIHRTREGRLPACVEACPAGARTFGNLLDEDGPLRQIIEEKRVFRLRPEIGNEPKLFYYSD